MLKFVWGTTITPELGNQIHNDIWEEFKIVISTESMIKLILNIGFMYKNNVL